MSNAQLTKIKLVGYKDNKFSKKIGDYTALINPESYSITQGTNINEKSAQGASVPVNGYNKGTPQTISFKILFDGTGVIKQNTVGVTILGGSNSAVTDDIKNFKKVVYDYQSDTHQPPYVQIQWGVLLFNCMLTNLTINFKLFKPDGTPVRAEADCTFNGVIDDKKLAALENKQSPDLTHIRTVLKGDTLPLMCYREYGDSKYYFEVARFNGLTDLKKLEPGTKIYFPHLINN